MTSPTSIPAADVSLLAADGARVAVYRHGAHVTSWRPAGFDDERLFLSSTSEFSESSAIRGGVPVIFPQFASRGSLPKHGFARTSEWVLTSIARPRDADARVSLQLTETPRSLDIWQHRFAADLVVTVGGASLTVALTITNTDGDPFVFTAALHTYLRVSDIRDVSIDGLGGTRYQESSGGAQHAQTDDTLRIAGEVDRIYFDMPRPLRVRDGQRTTGVAMSGFSDVVIWNPGAERGAALADLEPGGYARFVCVEAAAIGTPIELARGEQWTGSQTLTAE